MKKKYTAPSAEIIELEIDETICILENNMSTDNGKGFPEGDNGDIWV